MRSATRSLWNEQNRHPGDRHRLFSAVARSIDARRVLYPGSFVDIAASFVFDEVVYVDVDRRAAQFFADQQAVEAIIADHRTSRGRWQFVHADYTAELGLPDLSFDLLVSLYAGFVSESCTRYLRPGGWLLANPSHGDVAMASLDPAYDLWGVVTNRSGEYRVRTDGLERFLVPKYGVVVEAASVRESGRGVAYTRPAFAYLFQKRDWGPPDNPPL